MLEINFKKFEVCGIDYGTYAEHEHIFLFFGNKNFTKDQFKLFPSLKFQTLKQVHGNKAVYIEKLISDEIEADAQYTNQKNLALAIQTADCLPILCFDEKQKWIGAIHAGWRGVENQIVKKTMEKLGKSSNSHEFGFVVGPHIQQDSFEVDLDVHERLLKCTNPHNQHSFHHIIRDKYFPSLKHIVSEQLHELPIKLLTLQMSNVDTFRNEHYSSFRREKAPCRNWSFIYIK